MVKLDMNPELWEIDVMQEIEQSIPWLSPYVKGVQFQSVDATRGAGFGYVVLVNGQSSAGAIIIIRDNELLPIDVFEADMVMPLTERRIMEALGSPSPFNSLTYESSMSEPTDISNQVKPPMDAARPDSGMLVHASCQGIFDKEPSWKNDKMQSGPGWAWAKYSSYIKAGVEADDAKARVVTEFIDRKEL